MNAASKTALASRFAMKAQGIKVLAHALPRTWGQPCGVRKSALWSYDSRASGGSLYPLTAGARGKIRRETQKPSLGEVCRPRRENGGGFLQPVISVRDAYRTMFRQYPDVVSVEQMSEMLGVSSKTGYRLLRENSIAHFRVGRSYRIPKLHILSYLQVISGS